jgi:hypothetical protein
VALVADAVAEDDEDGEDDDVDDVEDSDDVGRLADDDAVVEEPLEVVAAVPSPAALQAAQNREPSPPASSIRRSTVGVLGVTPLTLRRGGRSGDPVSGVFGSDRQGGLRAHVLTTGSRAAASTASAIVVLGSPRRSIDRLTRAARAR